MPGLLIAEDDAVISENLKKALSKKGINVLLTDNGIEAVKLVKENNPDLLLLDTNLPGMSGVDVLKEAKGLNKDIKVIVMTGTFDSDTEKQVMELGSYALLRKPFMIEVLFKLLSDLGVIK